MLASRLITLFMIIYKVIIYLFFSITIHMSCLPLVWEILFTLVQDYVFVYLFFFHSFPLMHLG